MTRTKKYITLLILTLFIGNQCILAMEEAACPPCPDCIPKAQTYKVILREMINTIPDSAPSRPETLLAISSFIQAARLDLGSESADLIEKKNLGGALYYTAKTNNQPATRAWLLANNLVSQDFVNKSFQHSLSEGNLKEAKFLLSHGADINAFNQHGDTPLTLVCSEYLHLEGLKDTFMFLVQNGADVNAPNKYGNTPLWHILHQPAYFTSFGKDYIKELLDHGARLDIKNEQGHSTEDYLNGKISNDKLQQQYINSLIELGFGEKLGLKK